MSNLTTETQNDRVKAAFNNGQVLIYATEAVMGMGCDPDNQNAVEKLLALKNRPVEKGLILIAASYSQLLPYVDDKAIPPGRRPDIFSTWPAPVTFLLPKSSQAPSWITGEHASIATRVPAYAPLIELCEKLGKPIVSTSANLSGQPSCLTTNEAKQQFGEAVFYVEGVVQGRRAPSTIKDAITGKTVRGN